MKTTVLVAERLREEFFRKHRKDAARAKQAWKQLVAWVPTLETNPFRGDQTAKKLLPESFRGYENLWRLELPNGFRALYSVLGQASGDVIVAVDWIGDHKEYDELFGYSTS